VGTKKISGGKDKLPKNTIFQNSGDTCLPLDTPGSAPADPPSQKPNGFSPFSNVSIATVQHSSNCIVHAQSMRFEEKLLNWAVLRRLSIILLLFKKKKSISTKNGLQTLFPGLLEQYGRLSSWSIISGVSENDDGSQHIRKLQHKHKKIR
jgi:hypothetical protein